MITAVVQVRMGSERLPGKALAEVLGRPVLWHIVDRVRHAKSVAQVVIATTTETRDAPIRDFAAQNHIPLYAGSEKDLIDRLTQAARLFGASALVRITGDCPFADPALIDTLVAAFSAKKSLEYASNVHPPTYPDGLDTEIFSAAFLERLWKEIQEPFFREWFPSYVADHLSQFRTHNLAHPADLSGLRWTLDYEDDLTFTREVYRRLYRDGGVFGMEDILSLLRREPALAELNARHVRNESYTAALRAAGLTPKQGDPS
jgi:spore coat polysaccharide biosynthesis protein SpsF